MHTYGRRVIAFEYPLGRVVTLEVRWLTFDKSRLSSYTEVIPSSVEDVVRALDRQRDSAPVHECVIIQSIWHPRPQHHISYDERSQCSDGSPMLKGLLDSLYGPHRIRATPAEEITKATRSSGSWLRFPQEAYTGRLMFLELDLSSCERKPGIQGAGACLVHKGKPSLSYFDELLVMPV